MDKHTFKMKKVYKDINNMKDKCYKNVHFKFFLNIQGNYKEHIIV